MSQVCQRCKSTPKTWKGSDRECGFDDKGIFKSDNWRCPLLTACRQLMDYTSIVGYNNDEHIIVHAVNDESCDFIVLTWYKNRGKTTNYYLVESGELLPGTIQVAEKIFHEIERYTNDLLSLL